MQSGAHLGSEIETVEPSYRSNRRESAICDAVTPVVTYRVLPPTLHMTHHVAPRGVSSNTQLFRLESTVTHASFLLMVWLIPVGAVAQATPPTDSRTATQAVVLSLVKGIEKRLTAIAAEMPDDKYEFAPTVGAFRGVRNFAKQIKHAAAVQHLVAATILDERITADMSDERGPDAVKTKAEVLQYLQESFTALERAAATTTEQNAFAPVKGPFGSVPETRVGLIALAVSHSWNHYGQVVEYLRMNGIVPPPTE